MTETKSIARPVDVYLVSSTLHFFWAFVLAEKHQAERDSHLVLIDQYSNRSLSLYKFLTSEISPFVSQKKLQGRELKGIAKLKNRRKQFVWIKAFTSQGPIARLWIGNDRSVVGQWFIKQSKHNNPHAIACYMDDGVFSYLGRPASKSITERYIDAFLKKLAYGLWYDPPMTVGASKWIDQVWVMFPQFVNHWLKSKEIYPILPDAKAFEHLTVLSDVALKTYGLTASELQVLDVLITLPNQTLFSKIPDYQSLMHRLVANKRLKGLNVAVKYHPAAGSSDPLNLKSLGVVHLPSDLSFELLLPYIKHCTLIGDLSTTVLMGHLARMEQVVMLKLHDDEYSVRMQQLCENLSISVYSLTDFN